MLHCFRLQKITKTNYLQEGDDLQRENYTVQESNRTQMGYIHNKQEMCFIDQNADMDRRNYSFIDPNPAAPHASRWVHTSERQRDRRPVVFSVRVQHRAAISVTVQQQTCKFIIIIILTLCKLSMAW